MIPSGNLKQNNEYNMSFGGNDEEEEISKNWKETKKADTNCCLNKIQIDFE
jgi:hypothetical protein